MKAGKLVKTMTMAAVLAMTSTPAVWAYSGGGHISQQHEYTTGLHTSGRYGHSGQMLQPSPLLNSAMRQVSYARQNYGHMQSTGDPRRIAAARSMLTNAEIMLTTVMVDMTGVSRRQIGEMRQSGLDWGQVGLRIGIDMDAVTGRGNIYDDDHHDRNMGMNPRSDGYGHHGDMYGNDMFHSGGGGAGGYGRRGFAGHGGMMGGMH